MECFDHKAHLQQRALICNESMSHARVKTTQAFDAAQTVWKPVD